MLPNWQPDPEMTTSDGFEKLEAFIAVANRENPVVQLFRNLKVSENGRYRAQIDSALFIFRP